jgi:diaminopimelate decarboxylase
MTEILRPSLYGSQHNFVVVAAPENPRKKLPLQKYLVVGHCCESGDLLTPAPGAPDTLAPRSLAPAAIGDLLVIEGAGAYCSAMSAKNYNSFPEAPEVLLQQDSSLRLIRQRQSLDQILQNEMS